MYYRLAPENPFPAAVDDVIAVYRELLKSYKPRSIGIFGTSAGAVLTCEVAVRLKELGLPLPAALGAFWVLTDFSRPSDSREIFALDGFPGQLQPMDPKRAPDDLYPGTTDRRNPVLSPLFADLKGMPPTLLVTSTRDLLLSDTALFHRALLGAGDDAQLVVFEALPMRSGITSSCRKQRSVSDLWRNFLTRSSSHLSQSDVKAFQPCLFNSAITLWMSSFASPRFFMTI